MYFQLKEHTFFKYECYSNHNSLYSWNRHHIVNDPIMVWNGCHVGIATTSTVIIRFWWHLNCYRSFLKTKKKFNWMKKYFMNKLKVVSFTWTQCWLKNRVIKSRKSWNVHLMLDLNISAPLICQQFWSKYRQVRADILACQKSCLIECIITFWYYVITLRCCNLSIKFLFLIQFENSKYWSAQRKTELLNLF